MQNPTRHNGIGGDVETLPDAYHLADAHEKINSDTPPMLFLVGSEDNPERNQASRESLGQSGVSTKVVIHKGASHGHWNRIDWMEQVVDDISSFLGEHL